MCGRFLLKITPGFEKIFMARPTAAWEDLRRDRFNIAPTQPVAIVRAGDSGRELAAARWGLMPSWAKTADEAMSIGARSINARSETVASKPMFRSAFRKRRCLVPASGFYEWKREGDTKRPMVITSTDNRPLAFAGLWERWRDPESPETPTVESCTILTCAPNELMREIHDRMPVVLEPGEFDRWLDPELEDAVALAAMLDPYPAERMKAVEVSRYVNSPKNEGPRCIEPVEAEPPESRGLFG